MSQRRRLDLELLARGLVPSRSAARHHIAAGQVLVDGAVADKAARSVNPGQDIRLADPTAGRWVSRAAAKLDHALDAFALEVSGACAVDAGSSTGGFTHCLLERGAASVVAVDVGTDQLHPRLRADPRVEVREQTDIRTLTAGDLAATADIVVADLSFISLRLVLGTLADLAGRAPVVTLVKPQFEAGRSEVSRARGVIKDPVVHRRVLGDVVEHARTVGLDLQAVIVSPIRGGTGNVEFVAHLQAGGPSLDPVGAGPQRLDAVVREAEARAE